MVDHMKKVNKSGVLDAGEQARAVLFVAPAGATVKAGAAGAGGLVGALAGEALGKRRAKRDEAEAEADGRVREGGLSAQVPILSQAYLILTDRRWAVAGFGAMSGKPKNVIGAWDLDDITAFELKKGKLAGKVNVVFKDGSVASLDCPRGQKIDQFAEAATAAGLQVTRS